MDVRHQAPRRRKKKKKRKIVWKLLFILPIVIVGSYMLISLFNIPDRPHHSFFDNDDVQIIAYRGGSVPSPEHTLLAFERAIDMGATIIDFSVHQTADQALVLFDGEDLSRTSNGEGRIEAHTLQELRQLDAAYRFQDMRGRYIYRGQGIQIPTLEEVFESFSDTRMMIELVFPEFEEEEDTSTDHAAQPDYDVQLDNERVGSELDEAFEAFAELDPLHRDMVEQVWKFIDDYGVHDHVLVYSESTLGLEYLDTLAEGTVALGQGHPENQRFVFMHKIHLGSLYRPNFDALMMPLEGAVFNYVDESLLVGANQRNIALYYGPVDDEYDIHHLLDFGVDGIITTRPDLAHRVLAEWESIADEDR